MKKKIARSNKGMSYISYCTGTDAVVAVLHSQTPYSPPLIMMEDNELNTCLEQLRAQSSPRSTIESLNTLDNILLPWQCKLQTPVSWFH
ncbi:hypothetical protein OG21DRAFT_1497255 [Imleria badia]|nr:hypothetical protein OG21DRAFT_1497255 [Imleria badia]